MIKFVVVAFLGPPWAPGWPETDSPRKMIANSWIETEIRVLGLRFVAIFCFAGEAEGRKRPVKGRKRPAKRRKRPFDPKLTRQ